MKISPELILLLPALAAAAANTNPISEPSAPASRGSTGIDYRYVDAEPAPRRNTPKGSLDVPVDGQDGKPHAGPWVETTAERDRKVTKDTDDIDRAAVKYDTKIPSTGHISTEEGKIIPHSNGGVMDDRNRVGPKEGTRGTEGGVSEKGKENQMNAGKTPGSPKEAPPLPYGETQKLPSDSDSGIGSGSRTADGTGTLGMLEVRSDVSLDSIDWPLTF